MFSFLARSIAPGLAGEDGCLDVLPQINDFEEETPDFLLLIDAESSLLEMKT